MKGSSRRIVFASGLLCLVCAVALGVGVAFRTPPAPVIVTFDLDQVIPALDEYKFAQKGIADRVNQFKSEIDKKKATLEETKKRLETMPDGPDKTKLGQGYVRDQFQLTFDERYAVGFMEQMDTEVLRDLAEKIAAACKEMAIRSHYTMVFEDDSDQFPRKARDNVQQMVTLKRLWYVDPAHDVTNELVVLMNNQYAAAAKMPVPVPKPTPPGPTSKK